MFSSKKLWPHLHMKKCKTRRLLIVPISDLYIKLIIVISLFTQPAVYFGLQKKKKKNLAMRRKKRAKYMAHTIDGIINLCNFLLNSLAEP